MMASQGVLVKQKVKLLNQTDSLNMIKNVVRLGISVITYLRDLFIERAYDDVVFQGMTLKMLKRVDKKSDMLLNWLDKGIFDAIEKKYLQMLIFDINDIEDNTIECYKFTFNYNREDDTGDIDLSVESTTSNNKNKNTKATNNLNEQQDTNMNGRDTNISSNTQRLNDIKNRLLGIQGNQRTKNTLNTTNANPNFQMNTTLATAGNREILETIKKNHKMETAKKAKRLLETLVTLTADLGPLPERTYLSMKLLYYDEYTPEDYQPELFREPDEQDLIAFQKKPDLLIVGDLGTDHHALSVSISTTCTASRSWTFEELYEQLILIERKEKVQNSLQSIEALDEKEDEQSIKYDIPEEFRKPMESIGPIKNNEPIKTNTVHSLNLKTNTEDPLQNMHTLQFEQIPDIAENQETRVTKILSTFEGETNKHTEHSSLYIMDSVDTQKERTRQLKEKFKNQFNNHFNNQLNNQLNNQSNNQSNNPINNQSKNELKNELKKEKKKDINKKEEYTEGEMNVIISVDDPAGTTDEETKQKENKSNKKENSSKATENNEIEEATIKNYILSNSVTSKKKLRKMYRLVSDEMLQKILKALTKEGLLRKCKHGLYRICKMVDQPTEKEIAKKAFIKEKKKETKKETKKKDPEKKTRKEKKVKPDIKKKKSNNKILKQQNSLKHFKQTASNKGPPNHFTPTQNSILPLTKTNKNRNNTTSAIISASLTKEAKKTKKTENEHGNISENGIKLNKNVVSHNENNAKFAYNSSNNNNSNNTNNNNNNSNTNVHHPSTKLLNQKKNHNIDDASKTCIGVRKNKKNKTNNGGDTCRYIHLANNGVKKGKNKKKKKKGKTEMSEKTDETGEAGEAGETRETGETGEAGEAGEIDHTKQIGKNNGTIYNNHSIYTKDSGDENYTNVLDEVEKIYNDVCKSCKATKYINKEIISKGLGIESRLTKPLLSRLMKDGYVGKKHVKNKGYESFLYEPLQLTYKRKHLETDISQSSKYYPLKKKKITIDMFRK